MLIELGHNQPSTPLRMNNSTAYRIFNQTIKQKRSKSMDMKYYWLQDRVQQNKFDVYWRPALYCFHILKTLTIRELNALYRVGN
jgi:hypothetical protein